MTSKTRRPIEVLALLLCAPTSSGEPLHPEQVLQESAGAAAGRTKER